MADMNSKDYTKFLTSMAPEQAADFLRPALAQVLAGLEDSDKLDFLLGLLKSEDRDKLASMVHL